MTRDNHQLPLYDLRTDTTDRAVFRLRIADRQRERVASLKGIQRAHGDVGAWIGLTPHNI